MQKIRYVHLYIIVLYAIIRKGDLIAHDAETFRSVFPHYFFLN